jgi:hypothetical protein
MVNSMISQVSNFVLKRVSKINENETHHFQKVFKAFTLLFERQKDFESRYHD